MIGIKRKGKIFPKFSHCCSGLEIIVAKKVGYSSSSFRKFNIEKVVQVHPFFYVEIAPEKLTSLLISE